MIRAAVSIALLACSLGCGEPEPAAAASSVAQRAAVDMPAGCQPHIELHSAAFWATELGESEMWVLQNHRLNLWLRYNGSDRGRVVGGIRPGSRAVILDESPEAYRVRTPEGAVGWIGKVQVARTLRQDAVTFAPC